MAELEKTNTIYDDMHAVEEMMIEFSREERAMAIAPKFTSVLSMIGSLFIICQVIREGKLTTSTHHRLLAGMSFCDFIVSCWFFLTTWPIPKGTPVYGAIGNQAICSAQGFFSQFSLAVAMYNGSLSVFYLFKIRYGWTAAKITKYLEPFLHACALSIGLGTGIAGIFLDLYNNDSWECWISPLPQNCTESWKLPPGETTDCIRGDNASLYRWLFYYALLWLSILIVTLNMWLVYMAVLRQEQSIDRYLVRGSTQQRHHSRQVAIQGYFYCGAFYITWMFPTVTRLTQVVWGQERTPYLLILLTAIFVPFQGFFNFLVYVRPRKSTILESWKQSKRNLRSSWLNLRNNHSEGTQNTNTGRGGDDNHHDHDDPTNNEDHNDVDNNQDHTNTDCCE